MTLTEKLEILSEAERLYKLGFAVHWIKKNSKAPVKRGWSGGERDSWKELKKTYREGFGLGTQTGESSHLLDGYYLANIDLDIKSSKETHQKEALGKFDSLFPGLRAKAPTVITGYGFRFFIKTKEPTDSHKLAQSREITQVLMPSAPISKMQLNAVSDFLITEEDLKNGYRVRPAWEIEVMSSGRQVVLPPSIHPETGNEYSWQKTFTDLHEIPFIDIEAKEENSRPRGRPAGSSSISDFQPVKVKLKTRLSSDMINRIKTGDGVEDRSAECFSVCLAMVKARFSDDEILSVLTNTNWYLGETAYEHRKTKSRRSAAAWVRDYCLRKAKEELSGEKIFASEISIAPKLENENEKHKQILELVSKKDSANWKERLKLSKHGKILLSLFNTRLILENQVGRDFVKRDEFSIRDTYSKDTPWGSKKDAMLTDDDVVRIRSWLAKKFNFEPPKSTLEDALSGIALDNAFHPVKMFLETLPAWDGVERLNIFLRDYFGSKDPEIYTADIFRKWMVGAIKRIYEPGCIFDNTLILQGLQDSGKSSFGPDLFGQAFSLDWLPNLADKEAAMTLQGSWVIELGELSAMTKSDTEATKAFLTRRVDKYRPAYGRRLVEQPRRCIFYGTTNKDEYLKDDTGERRFHPTEIQKLNFKALERDRLQLWAEAYFLYQNGLEPTLRLEGEAKRILASIHKEKKILNDADHIADTIIEFVSLNKVFDFSSFRLKDLFNPTGPLADWNFHKSSRFAGSAIRKLGGVVLRKENGNYWKIEKSNLAYTKNIKNTVSHLH